MSEHSYTAKTSRRWIYVLTASLAWMKAEKSLLYPGKRRTSKYRLAKDGKMPKLWALPDWDFSFLVSLVCSRDISSCDRILITPSQTPTYTRPNTPMRAYLASPHCWIGSIPTPFLWNPPSPTSPKRPRFTTASSREHSHTAPPQPATTRPFTSPPRISWQIFATPKANERSSGEYAWIP